MARRSANNNSSLTTYLGRPNLYLLALLLLAPFLSYYFRHRNMPDVLMQLKVNAPASRVFDAFATPEGLDSWWTLSSSGLAKIGSEWRLYFGPEYDWRARVTKCRPNEAIEWTVESAMDDWIGTRVGAIFTPAADATIIDFYHKGWVEPADHFRISVFCWASYLRLLRRNIEFGEFVPYELRNDV